MKPRAEIHTSSFIFTNIEKADNTVGRTVTVNLYSGPLDRITQNDEWTDCELQQFYF